MQETEGFSATTAYGAEVLVIAVRTAPTEGGGRATAVCRSPRESRLPTGRAAFRAVAASAVGREMETTRRSRICRRQPMVVGQAAPTYAGRCKTTSRAAIT